MTTTTIERRTLTQDELADLARARFGTLDPLRWAFECPGCGDVTTGAEFAEATGTGHHLLGQECIGRQEHAPAGRGCNWTAYGLIPGPWEITVPAWGTYPERVLRGFPLASAPADDVTLPPGGPTDRNAHVWIATTRRGVQAHRPDGDLTACRRSMRTGHRVAARRAVGRYEAVWCGRCWPASA